MLWFSCLYDPGSFIKSHSFITEGLVLLMNFSTRWIIATRYKLSTQAVIVTWPAKTGHICTTTEIYFYLYVKVTLVYYPETPSTFRTSCKMMAI